MIVLYLFILLIGQAFAFEDISKSMVPHSKVYESRGRTFILKSKAGSKIQIRYNLDGSFKDASGIDLSRGDELEPGEGLLSLSSVAQIIGKSGEGPRGFWILEKDKIHGWIYDIQGTLINAKTGRIISDGTDQLPQKNPNLSESSHLSEAKLKKSSLFQ